MDRMSRLRLRKKLAPEAPQRSKIDLLIDWGLTAFSTQINYIVPLKSMLQFKN